LTRQIKYIYHQHIYNKKKNVREKRPQWTIQRNRQYLSQDTVQSSKNLVGDRKCAWFAYFVKYNLHVQVILVWCIERHDCLLQWYIWRVL